MSASMAEVIDGAIGNECSHTGPVDLSAPGGCPECWRLAQEVAEALAANGYGNLGPTQFVLGEREAELLKLKGPCSNKDCPLHYAHSGPCDRRPE